MNWKSLVELTRSGEANSFPRDLFILHECPKRKYNNKMIDIHYLNSHGMENDRFTAIKMYMWGCSGENVTCWFERARI